LEHQLEDAEITLTRGHKKNQVISVEADPLHHSSIAEWFKKTFRIQPAEGAVDHFHDKHEEKR
jgi:hypothetical protein